MNEIGMTLLELVVGLTVAGMALSAGYGALGTIVTQRERARAAVAATAHAAAIRRTLVGWLDGARLSVDAAAPAFRGMDGVSNGIPDDDLSFLTTGVSPVSNGETVVRLYIDRDTTTREQGLVAELSRWPASATRSDVRRLEIDPHVAGLEVRYFTRMLGHVEWLPSWISSTVLPAGIEVTLIPEPGDTLPALLALPIVLSLGPVR